MIKLWKSWRASSWLELALRWLLGATFIYASFHKISAPADFAKILYGYALLPGALINLIAIILPFVELVTGLALVLGVYPRSAALIICALLLMFIVILAINLLRGHEFDCGCFYAARPGDSTTAGLEVVRDGILLVFDLQILFFNGRRRACVKPAAQ